MTAGREAGGARTVEGGVGGSVSREEAVEGNKCVVLKDNFPVTQGGEGGDAPAEYFFWQVCREPYPAHIFHYDFLSLYILKCIR